MQLDAAASPARDGVELYGRGAVEDAYLVVLDGEGPAVNFFGVFAG